MPSQTYKTPISLAKYSRKIKKPTKKVSQAGSYEREDADLGEDSKQSISKAKIKEEYTSKAIGDLNEEKTPEVSIASGGFKGKKQKLSSMKKAYQSAAKSGDKSLAKELAKEYNDYLSETKSYIKGNYGNIIKSKKLDKKYKKKINKAMDMDQTVRGLNEREN